VTGAWVVERTAGDAAAFHGRDLPPRRGVWWFEPTAPALVLGSTQSPDVVAAGADVAVVRRHSGGGAVLLVPGEVVWVDVVVPRGDPWWDDDVGRAAHWLGSAWVEALAACGRPGGEVHRGGLCTTPWSRLVCFAGLGPGEVSVDGRKVVGISQRRTRELARFQCAVHRRFDPAAMVRLLAPPRPEPEEIDVVGTVDAAAAAVVEALVAVLR
jgi:lipoate-protein ligase A